MVKKIKEVLDFQEAMGNLATIAEINMEHPPLLGIIKEAQLVTDAEEFPMGSIQWLSAEGEEIILDVLDKTYQAIYQYLISLYENRDTDWKSNKLKTGIAATMSLVGESAEKMDRYLPFRKGGPLSQKIVEREAFQSLQQFYLQKFQAKFSGGIEGEEAWEEEWIENSQGPSGVISGLKDFETVIKDREYELFYIRNEEGLPYFSPELLRNIKLTVDLESTSDTFEEDPLLKVRAIQDRDLCTSARQILNDCYFFIEDFCKTAKKLKSNDLAQMLNQAIMALFLSSNPRNLLQNTVGKHCFQYFLDFQFFLRKAMKTQEYQKWIAYPPDPSEKIAFLLLKMTHALARGFFTRPGGVKQEAIGLIHRTMRKGEEVFQEKQKALLKADHIWSQFLLSDEWLRAYLHKFPNGPLFKILDFVRESEADGVSVPFDPLGQENLPSLLFKIVNSKIVNSKTHIDVLRCPSPVIQSCINKADIADEFRGFLRSLSASEYRGLKGRIAFSVEATNKRHLLFNLNDRTSWREFVRSRGLENLQKNAEFNQKFFVVTLPKDTDFYTQNNEYLHLNRSEDFIAAFLEQIASKEECGYFFPSAWPLEDVMQFAKDTLPAIHAHFFHKKETLTRRDREDFIEIFYQLLIVKAIERFKPDSISFTCKDAIDTGAAQGALLYGFLKLLSGKVIDKEAQDFLLWLFYAPALFIRERGIDPERFNRAVSILDRLDSELSTHREEILKTFENFYEPGMLGRLGAS
ncbi:MAG TPA: hypothetical protein VLE95_03500 [Chlamydiales bacterium]|nr:hypothetical protein [Chlamydiales bacterium]